MKAKSQFFFSSAVLQELYCTIVKLFKPWIFPVDTDEGG